MSQYTRRQIVTLVVFCICQLCNAVCISLQAPFYPAEAEAKGAVPSQYGFVFGIYELVVFVMCLIYGKYIDDLGVKLVNNTGIFTVGISCVLFGFLNLMEGVYTFLIFSFLIRIVEATGAAAFSTAAFSIIAGEFPDSVGTAFAFIETFFGIGLILGPTIGGALYELGGFMLPFLVVGILLILAGILVLVILPTQDEDFKDEKTPAGLFKSALKDPAILLYLLTTGGASISIGFLQATLEPHLRPLNLTPLTIGLIFVLNGATYALSAPIWGRLCDNHISPRTACAIGAFLVIISFLIVGPAPFLPLQTSLPLCIGALVIHGIGFGAELVATFSGLHKDALKRGFPDNISTYSLISGFWTSSFALGCFIGPSAAGLLFDAIGFPWATITVVVLHFIIFVLTSAYIIYSKKKARSGEPNELEQSLVNGELPNIRRSRYFNRKRRPSYGSISYPSDLYVR